MKIITHIALDSFIYETFFLIKKNFYKIIGVG